MANLAPPSCLLLFQRGLHTLIASSDFQYFYAYQGAVTAHIFNGRTRALVAVLSSIGSMSGALVMGFVLDKSPFSTRRMRGFVGVTLCIVACIVIWGCGLAYQLGFDRKDGVMNLDWEMSESSKPLALIFFFYWFDAAFQSLICE